MRSKMWVRGRKLRARSSEPIFTVAMEATTLDTRLPWVSMAPLGSAVVPEV